MISKVIILTGCTAITFLSKLRFFFLFSHCKLLMILHAELYSPAPCFHQIKHIINSLKQVLFKKIIFAFLSAIIYTFFYYSFSGHSIYTCDSQNVAPRSAASAASTASAYLGTCWECKLSGPSPDLFLQKLWRWSPEVFILSPACEYNACWSLRTTQTLYHTFCPLSLFYPMCSMFLPCFLVKTAFFFLVLSQMPSLFSPLSEFP